MTEEDLPQTSRSRRWIGRGAVIAGAVIVGIVISDLALSLQGPRYAATVTVRPLINNPLCVYTPCPNQAAVAGGYMWIISQANLVSSKAVASRVHDAIKGSPSVAALRSNVRVKENNDSDSIDITYTGGSAGMAQRLAVSFANQYKAETINEIRTALHPCAGQGKSCHLADPTKTAQTTFDDLVNQGLQRTPRGTQVMTTLNALLVANAVAAKHSPPGAADVYAPYPGLVPVQRTTPSLFRATLLGAATGLVIGFGLVLALGTRGPRRPRRPHLRRRRSAVAGEA